MKNINLEKLLQAQFDLAKFWFATASACGVAIFLIDIIVVFLDQLNKEFALVVALFVVLNVVFSWRSDRLREDAEALLRKFETYNSLGWGISSRELVSLLADVPNKIKQAARSKEEYNYFASEKDKGIDRLLENLEESAWWSKHLARRMAKYVFSFGVVVLSLSFISLIIAIQSSLPSATSDSIAKIIVASVVFMFSGGYIRIAFDYNLFANQATDIEETAFRLQSDQDVSEIEAIKLLHDYQIERANSPLLPSLLWKTMNKELNALWDERLEAEGKNDSSMQL